MYMKKNYFIFAAALMALASCQTDDYLGNNPGNAEGTTEGAIRFDGGTGKITRADQDKKTGADAAELLDKNFVVVGYKNGTTGGTDGSNLAFDHYNVNYLESSKGSTASNTEGWEYVGQKQEVRGNNDKKLAGENTTAQTIKYWDNSCSSYDFFAFSMGKGYKSSDDADKTYATPSAVQKDKLSTEAYTLKGDVNTLGECYISDITTVNKTGNSFENKAVSMSFRHASSKVRIALYESVPGYVISDVKFHGDAYTSGDYTEGEATGKLFGSFNKQGTLTVYFPTTGSENTSKDDYNKAHVKFTADESGTDKTIDFGNVNYGNQAEDAIKEGSSYLSQSAAKPSYCGTSTYYKTVLPAEDKSEAATIHIDYKLTATDGSGEVINVKNATATIPAAYTAWKHGYAYTYIFQISKNTNGTTGTNPGTDDKGLTAISFDAVVLDDEITGKQETITNTAECSITTYGFKDGKVTTNSEEYPAGADIYATAYIPKHNCTVEGENTQGEFRTPTALYTVTLEDGAAQTINETSVINALKTTPTGTEGSKTWTVTDANSKKMTVTQAKAENVTKVPTEDGIGLTVNAFKWTGTANTTYVVEYNTNCTMKAYKIVKVEANK